MQQIGYMDERGAGPPPDVIAGIKLLESRDKVETAHAEADVPILSAAPNADDRNRTGSSTDGVPVVVEGGDETMSAAAPAAAPAAKCACRARA